MKQQRGCLRHSQQSKAIFIFGCSVSEQKRGDELSPSHPSLSYDQISGGVKSILSIVKVAPHKQDKGLTTRQSDF